MTGKSTVGAASLSVLFALGLVMFIFALAIKDKNKKGHDREIPNHDLLKLLANVKDTLTNTSRCISFSFK